MAKIYPEIVEDYHGSYGEFQIFESCDSSCLGCEKNKTNCIHYFYKYLH